MSWHTPPWDSPEAHDLDLLWDSVAAELPSDTPPDQIRREVEDRIELMRDPEYIATVKGDT